MKTELRASIRKRTIPTERPPLVGEVSDNLVAVNFGFLDPEPPHKIVNNRFIGSVF
jgi:hypothetical protein